jgi:nucleoid-associated protein YgaU
MLAFWGALRRRIAPLIRGGETMGFFDFVKEAGEKLFRAKDSEAASEALASAPDDAAAKTRVDELNRTAAEAIEAYINSQNLPVTGLTVSFDGASGVATIFGVAGDQASKEKILLCGGNVSGVSQVKDMMSVDQSAPEAAFYTVVAGDTLSKIAKAHYADANQYMRIFKANQPMLSDPNKIYPGQVLRIPPL